MRHENTKYLFNYWNNLRNGRSAPDRREIEPSDIRNILGDTFILELNQKFKTLSFRLAGTRLCNAYGRELKGVGFLALWDETDNLNIYKTVRSVFEENAPCIISFVAESEQHQYIECEMLLLPLLNGLDHASRVLGIISMFEKPKWLGTDPIQQNRLKMSRVLELPAVSNYALAAPGLDPVAHVENVAAKKVGHLTIIKGGIE